MRCLDEATAAALAGDATVPISSAWTCCFLVWACTAALDYGRAFEWCDRIAEFAERYGSRYMLAFCRAAYGAVHLWRGRWADAETLLEASIEDFSRSRLAWAEAPLVTLAELRWRQGRPTEAMRLAKLRGPKRLAPVERQPGAAELRRRRSARLVQHHPSDDTIVIELVEPADMPAVVRIVWPSAPTITTPAKLNEVAAKAMKILAYASTRYAQIRAQRRC